MKTRILILSAILFGLIAACTSKNTANVKQENAVSIQPADYAKMILAKVYIKPGKEGEFIKVAKEMVENSQKEEGCQSYMLYQDPYEKTNFIVVEKYKNQAAVDAHFGMPYFKEFGPKIADITSGPIEIKIYDIAGEK
jgi:quinol monooxygenase YgiN